MIALYVTLVAVLVAATIGAVWLKREGERNWERVLIRRRQEALTHSFVALGESMRRFADAMQVVGAAFASLGQAMTRGFNGEDRK